MVQESAPIPSRRVLVRGNVIDGISKKRKSRGGVLQDPFPVIVAGEKFCARHKVVLER